MKIENILKIIVLLIIVFLGIILKPTCVKAVTEIPKVYIEGNIDEMYTKEDEREISIKYNSKDINFEHFAKIKIQGTSSLGFEKKNYTITFYEDNTYDEKQKVDVGKGWGAQNKYGLKANWIDKTHSRNIVSARIVAKIQDKYGLLKETPNNGLIDGFPVEIYSNNEFLGLYTWNIPKSDWMWGLDEDNPNNIALVGDGWTDAVAFKEEITSFEEAQWEVEVGEKNQETKDKFNRIINFVNNSSDEEFIRDFDLYLNKDATLNYIIMLYAMEASDNFGKNMIMLTYDGKIWYPSLYDLDSTGGTWSTGALSESYDYVPDNAESRLLSRVINLFNKELADRWFELRKTNLSKTSILNEFNTFINSIPKEIYEKEQERWGEIPGYEIDQIEEFLDYRLNYVDNIMNDKLEGKTFVEEKEDLAIEKEEVIVENTEDTNKSKTEGYLNVLVFVNVVLLIINIVLFIKNYRKSK